MEEEMIDWTKKVKAATDDDITTVLGVIEGMGVVKSGTELYLVKPNGEAVCGHMTFENVPEKVKIVPESGQVWENYNCGQIHRCFISRDDGGKKGLHRVYETGVVYPMSDSPSFGDMIHGENGWTRVYPPVGETDTVKPTAVYPDIDGNEIEVGGKYRIIKSAEAHEKDVNGKVWVNSWTTPMHEKVGEIGTVDEVNDSGVWFIEARFNGRIFPWFVLRRVS
jgi:hypothetical protein